MGNRVNGRFISKYPTFNLPQGAGQDAIYKGKGNFPVTGSDLPLRFPSSLWNGIKLLNYLLLPLTGFDHKSQPGAGQHRRIDLQSNFFSNVNDRFEQRYFESSDLTIIFVLILTNGKCN